mgnify:CR=1 FL=1
MNPRPTVTKRTSPAAVKRPTVGAGRTPASTRQKLPSNVTPISSRRQPARNTRASRNLNAGAAKAFLGNFAYRVISGQSMLFYLTAGVALILAIFGVIMVLSASSIQSIKETGQPWSYAWRQALFALVGTVVLMVASLLPVETYMRQSLKFWIFVMGMQVFALLFGRSINGNKEWIVIGPFTIQPGEILKLAVIICMATYYQRNQGLEWNYRMYGWVSLTFFVVSAGAIFLGSDMGTVMVLGLIAIVMLWLSEVPRRAMNLPLVFAGIGVAAGLFGSATRRARLDAWLNPGNNDLANQLVWQSVHGVWALANSNIIGRGLGMSSMKWSWIPEVQNDYIFAIIGEELGIFGALAVLLLFVALGYLILQIANRSQDLFSRMVCYGVAAWLVLQAFINISVVLRLLPVLGVPLPLISYGGSSMVTGLAAIGVVLSIERRNHQVLDGHTRGPIRARR